MFDSEFIANPYPAYTAMRSSAPMHWMGEFLGGAWLFPRYADIGALLRDPRLSAKRSHCFTALMPPEMHKDFLEFDRIFAMWLLFLDAPEHSQLRKLMNHGFSPTVIEQWRAVMQQTADELLERNASTNEMDFMAEFAHLFPAIVISEMLGVDVADQAEFIEWSDDIAAFFGNPACSPETAYRARDSLLALTNYFREVLPERRSRPGKDLISLLLRIEEDGELITAEQVVSQCSMLMFGGHETTRNLLGNGLLALLKHPQQLALLRNDPSLMQNAIKELLRYDSPVQYLTRLATEDIVLHGNTIHKGQFVIPIIASANRDETQFEDPDTLDITRKDVSYFSFGHGAHVCIGTRLAFMEAEIALNTLFRKYPDLHLAKSQPVWTPNFGFRGMRSLPIVLEREHAHMASLTADSELEET